MTTKRYRSIFGLFLAILLKGFLFEDTENGGCRPGFVRVDQWCFSFHVEPASMLRSSDVCHQHGAHMVVLDSQEKEKALTDYIERMKFFNISRQRKELYKMIELEWNAQQEKNKFCEDFLVHGDQSTNYRHIPNAKIPLGSPPQHRANRTTPHGFSIKLSSIPGAGMGAWADEFIPRYTVLGVYEGLIHTKESNSELYSWQVDKLESEGIYTIDATDPACSNWLRFVNSPMTYKQENVMAVACAGVVFYITSRDVEPGTELLVWYGDGYGHFLGVSRIHPEADLNYCLAFRANVVTFTDQGVLEFDDRTPMTYQNWGKKTGGWTLVDRLFGLLLTYNHDNKWQWVAERNYTYYTGQGGFKLPFICEDSPES